MKDAPQVTCCVVDYGAFITLAQKLSETYARVIYAPPIEREFRDIRQYVMGMGVEGLERPPKDDFFYPSTLKDIDLFVFPDIGFGGVQQYLRSIGKAVWGSNGASDLELYRTRFLELLKDLGLPVAPSVVIRGLTNLELYLKEHDDLWIKVNAFRENMETWHHKDYEHSRQKLMSLHHEMGAHVGDLAVFVAQESIPNAQEVGYDGLNVDGLWPRYSFQGYEKKNELYLGSCLSAGDLPDAVKMVNEALSPWLREVGYRNFLATEIRNQFFIDPTFRQAGQTQEHLQETCTNLAEVIWAAANGELLEPEYSAMFAAEATLHYTEGTDDWMTWKIPDNVKQWVKPDHFCVVDGMIIHPPRKSGEVGVVVGNGHTVEEAIEDVKAHLADLEGEPVSANIEGFASILADVQKAALKGIDFGTDDLPPLDIALPQQEPEGDTEPEEEEAEP